MIENSEKIENGLSKLLATGQYSSDEIAELLKRANSKSKSVKSPKTKARSVKNVQDIQKRISNGETSPEIGNVYGISRWTIRNYLFWLHPKRPDTAQKYWQLLLDNDRRSKSEESKSEELKSEEPKFEEPKSEEPKFEEPKSEYRFLLDVQLIARHDSRIKWGKLLKKLKENKSYFAFSSQEEMQRIAETFTFSAAEAAKTILGDDSIPYLNTNLRIWWAAAMFDMVVITDYEPVFQQCIEKGTKVIMLDDFLN